MKLLVPIDLSAATAGVLDAARRVAIATRGGIWLLNVAPPDPAFIGYEVQPLSPGDNTGDGLVMAMEAGAQLANMTSYFGMSPGFMVAPKPLSAWRR